MEDVLIVSSKLLLLVAWAALETIPVVGVERRRRRTWHLSHLKSQEYVYVSVNLN